MVLLPPCSLLGVATLRPPPLGPGRGLTLPCGWNNAGAAIRVAPRHYNAWYGLGYVYYRQEKYELAEYHFKRAAAINPQSSVLMLHIGLVRIRACACAYNMRTPACARARWLARRTVVCRAVPAWRR